MVYHKVHTFDDIMIGVCTFYV